MASNPETLEPHGKLPTKGQWTTGLYDCWEDPSHCCFTWFCPCITFGQIAEIVDGGIILIVMPEYLYLAAKSAACCIYTHGMSWLNGAIYRSKLRRLFSLPEEPYSDSFIHCCCCVCSLTQEFRELINRGINPSLDWEGNVEKWKREGVEPPIVPTMSR